MITNTAAGPIQRGKKTQNHVSPGTAPVNFRINKTIKIIVPIPIEEPLF